MEKYRQNILLILLLASVWPLAVYPVERSTEASRTVAVAMDVMDGSIGDADVAGDGFWIKEITYRNPAEHRYMCNTRL